MPERLSCRACGTIFEGDPGQPQVCPKCGTVLPVIAPLSPPTRAAQMTILEPASSASGPGASAALRGSSSTVRRAPGDLPRQVDGHDIVSLLGYGGMGSVFLAFEPLLDREVALKLLSRSENDLERSAQTARFLAEASLTGKLAHAAIIPIYRVGHDPSYGYYYTMRFVKGRTLATVIDRLVAGDPATQEEFSLNRLLSIFVRICQAVGFAHQHGIIHRDIKPPNLMVADFGEVFVLDWGLAKQVHESDYSSLDAQLDTGAAERLADARKRRYTAAHMFLSKDRKTGQTSILKQLQAARPDAAQHPVTPSAHIVGTPGYLSPEQGEGKPDIAAASDVYSLGVTLYELLTLRQPVEAETTEALIARTIMGQIVPIKQRATALQLPTVLCDIVSRALALNPADRYADAKEMAEELTFYLEGRSPQRPLVHAVFRGSALPEVFDVLKGETSVAEGEALLETGAIVRCKRYPTGDYRWDLTFHVETEDRRWVSILGVLEVMPDQTVQPRYEIRLGVEDRPFLELRRSGMPVQRRFDVRIQAGQKYNCTVEVDQARIRVSLDQRLLIDYTEAFPQTGAALELRADSGAMYIESFKLVSRGAPLNLSFMVLPDRLYRISKFAEARELYRQLNTSHPDRAEGLIALYKAGLCSTALGELQDAFTEFTRLEGTMYEHCCALGLAQIGLRDGNIDWAWEALKNGYKLHRTADIRSEMWLSLLNLVEKIDRKQSSERVRRLRELLVDLDPVPHEAAQVTYDLLDAVEQHEGLAGVRREAAQLLERFGNNALVLFEAMIAMGRAGIDVRNELLATRILDRLLASPPTGVDMARFHLLRAELYMAEGNYDAASYQLRDAFVIAGWKRPDGLWARGWNSLVTYLRGQHQSVLIEVHENITRSKGMRLPQVGFFHVLEGMASLQRKQMERAKTAFRRCCEVESIWAITVRHAHNSLSPEDLLKTLAHVNSAQVAEALLIAGEIHSCFGNVPLAAGHYAACLQPQFDRAFTMRLAERRLAELNNAQRGK